MFLDITLSLEFKGLAFQNDNSWIGDIDNSNFMNILELLGKYDVITCEQNRQLLKNEKTIKFRINIVLTFDGLGFIIILVVNLL